MSKVLVVVDMQNDFVSGALAAPNGPSIVAGVIDCINNFDGEVVYTLDTHYDNYLQTQEGTNLPVPHCVKDSDGWKLPADIQAALDARGAKCFEKPSFGSPDLALALVEKNKVEPIEEVVLIGICTDICVITNTMTIKCFLPEVKVSVKSQLCAGVSDQSHQTALDAMRMCQVNIE